MKDHIMAQIQTEIRHKSGKGVARKLRVENKIPAVLYGAGEDPQPITVSGYDIMMGLQNGGFFTNMQELMIDGKAQKALARDIQRNPVSEKVEHVDFLRFDPKQVLKVNVQVTVTDEDKSPGLEKGGVLQLVRSEVELFCRADSIPDSISLSMAGKDIGDSCHISEVDLPEGVKPTNDRDFTVASIVGTRSSTMADLDADGNEIDPDAVPVEGEEGQEGDKTEGDEKSDS